MKSDLQKTSLILDSIGLYIIGIACLGYFLGIRRFAELHLDFSLINFPIFIGEILLFSCLTIFIIKTVINRRNVGFMISNQKTFSQEKRFYLFLGFFAGFVLAKALAGYFKWGPLALRQAALFYYPVFAIFTAGFFHQGLFKNKNSWILTLLILTIFRFGRFYEYCLLTYAVLALVFILNYPYRLLKYVMFLLFILCVPFKMFFLTSRTFLVANLAALLFIAIALFFILKIKKKFRVIILIIFIMMLIIGVFRYVEKYSSKTLLQFRKTTQEFKKYDNVILHNKDKFKTEKLAIQLYNPDIIPVPPEIILNNARIILAAAKRQVKKVKDNLLQENKPQPQQTLNTISAQENKLQIQQTLNIILMVEQEVSDVSSEAGSGRSYETEKILSEAKELQVELNKLDSKIKAEKQTVDNTGRFINSLFRLFIWRDILTDLINGRQIIGFDFGRPFRSKSLEILNWGCGDWARDGWIAVHNSYLQILYNSGIVGIIFILFIFGMLVKMIKLVFILKSVEGLLLCTALINWFVAANFLVILELPYNAIPIWSLFGITWAYLRDLNKNIQNAPKA